MLDAVVGAVIIVVATTSLAFAIEAAEKAFNQAGRYPLSQDEIKVLIDGGVAESSQISGDILNLPREVGGKD